MGGSRDPWGLGRGKSVVVVVVVRLASSLSSLVSITTVENSTTQKQSVMITARY